jgi:electron transport complex protein RnfB
VIQHEKVYKSLREHLDAQAVGFPATRSGEDIRILRRLFTPDEARLALYLSYRPTATSQVAAYAAREFAAADVERLLDSMIAAGAIGWKVKEGRDYWFLLPMVVGMYEGQDGELTRDFQRDADAYMGTLAWGKALLAAIPSQMRTIPVNISIPVENAIATYDRIRAIVKEAPGPFVVLKCICRENARLKERPCRKTNRQETCLVFGSSASAILRRHHGRETTRGEVLEILEQNERDGLVLQPANAREPSFVCSCCGCCCGMLGYQKVLPHPVDFWTSDFFAEVHADLCTHCGKCVSRCQVDAVTLGGSPARAVVNLSRCIGCGLCVPTCAAHAMHLRKKEQEAVIPRDEEDLYETIMANKKGMWQRSRMFLKVLLKMRQ